MGHTEKRIIRGVWLGSSAANTPSFASVVQVGEVQGDWCTQQLPLAAIPFFCPSKTGALITNQLTVPQPGVARAV